MILKVGNGKKWIKVHLLVYVSSPRKVRGDSDYRRPGKTQRIRVRNSETHLVFVYFPKTEKSEVTGIRVGVGRYTTETSVDVEVRLPRLPGGLSEGRFY